MSSTTTTTTTAARLKPILLYSLPYDCPIPFQPLPSYPILDPSLSSSNGPRDLRQSYLHALYSSTQPFKFTLDAFARLLLSFANDQLVSASEPLLRQLVIPLHDFDRKWRSSVPKVVKPKPGATEEGGGGGKKERLEEGEKELVRRCCERWKEGMEEKIMWSVGKKLMVVEGTEEGDDKEGKEDASEEHAGERDKPSSWTVQEVNVGDWVTDRELFDTLLQSLLLLTLLTLPKQRPSQTPLSPSSSTTTTTTSQPPPPPTTRKSKKTDPERNSSTLDPEVLLDFLTDRLQIWRVLKDVNSLGLGGGGGGSGGDSQQQQQQEKGKEQKTTTTTTTSVERDEVQVWWEDVVEPLFTSHLQPSLLSYHHTKLFPSPTSSTTSTSLSTTSSQLFSHLSIQSIPSSASPFKPRSLLSLDQSARKREREEEESKGFNVPESPTMKRLIGFGVGRGVGVGGGVRGGGEEVFKVPSLPMMGGGGGQKRRSSESSLSLVDTIVSNDFEPQEPVPTQLKKPRKQPLPRPLPRGDAFTRGSGGGGSSKSLFNRREVSLPALGGGGGAVGRKRKAAEKEREKVEKEKRERGEEGGGGGERARQRKRKSVSPKKLNSTTSSTLLVPDTPAHHQPTKKKPNKLVFSRSSSSTSTFAALGAAFRPGLRPEAVAFTLPSLEVEVPMDWEEEEDDDEMMLRGGGAGGKGERTPVSKRVGGWVVPDT